MHSLAWNMSWRPGSDCKLRGRRFTWSTVVEVFTGAFETTLLVGWLDTFLDSVDFHNGYGNGPSDSWGGHKTKEKESWNIWSLQWLVHCIFQHKRTPINNQDLNDYKLSPVIQLVAVETEYQIDGTSTNPWEILQDFRPVHGNVHRRGWTFCRYGLESADFCYTHVLKSDLLCQVGRLIEFTTVLEWPNKDSIRLGLGNWTCLHVKIFGPQLPRFWTPLTERNVRTLRVLQFQLLSGDRAPSPMSPATMRRACPAPGMLFGKLIERCPWSPWCKKMGG